MKIHELGHVVLYVSNLTRSLSFYRDILGFACIHHDDHTAAFSSGRTHHELLLIAVGGRPKHRTHPTPGLYHIGLNIGSSDRELKAAIKELEHKEVQIVGYADHTVTHSVYIQDPDGNEIELYVDVNDGWKKDPTLVMAPTKPLSFRD